MSTSPIYLINPVPDQFRWLAIVEDKHDWGIRAAKIKDAAVGSEFGPIPVEWTPETINRPAPDFPNFRTNLLCVSAKARAILMPLFAPCGEWIPLNGHVDDYSAFHCLQITHALDGGETDSLLSCSVYKSFHSPRFVPALRANCIPRAHVFRIPESVSKLFVSQDFKLAYDQHGLSGLEFFDVELTA